MSKFFRATAANGQGIKLQRYENEIFFDGEGLVPETFLKYVSNFSYQTGDILLVAHPKSGTHWMGNMVWKLKTLSDYKRPKLTVLEFMENEVYEMQESPRILHTHLRPSRLPIEHISKNGKIVLMLRNPKDVCVSLYHHLRDSSLILNGQTFDEYFESFFSGEMWYTSYIETLKEWEEVLYEKANGMSALNIEVFYYEDCWVNPMDNLVRLNDFLGLGRDQAYLQQVLEQISFDAMKIHEMEDKKRINQFCFNTEGNSLIYRKGKIGDWKNHLTVAQSERVDQLMKDKLTRGIIRFTYCE